MTQTDPPDILRGKLLLLLEDHHKTGSPYYVSDEQLAAATGAPLAEIQTQLDILEELEYTTTANSHDGRRARISARGLLAAEQLRAPAPAPTKPKPPIGF